MNYSDFKTQYASGLNPQQEAAVCAVHGPVLLLAVPGSGKTTVLVTRLGYMVLCQGILPDSHHDLYRRGHSGHAGAVCQPVWE